MMVFLGSDSQEAINKIQSDSNLDKGSAILAISESGFPELSLPLDKRIMDKYGNEAFSSPGLDA